MRPAARAATIAAIAVVAVVIIALATGAGSSTQPPATGAATVVPAGALAYVNVSIDRRRPAVAAALAQAAKFPGYASARAELESRLTAITATAPAGFAVAARPWIGDEVGLALLQSTRTSAGSLTVLSVRSMPAARAFLDRPPAAPAGSYRGTVLTSYPGGARAAILGHYLVLGQPASVRAAIAVQSGAAPSLAAAAAYRRAVASEPAGRVLDAYASPLGLQRLILARGGGLAALATLLVRPSLRGVALSVSPARGGAQVQVHTIYGPGRSTAASARQAAVPFRPTLPSVVPAGATLLLDVRGLANVAPKLLTAGVLAGFGAGVGPLLRKLGQALASEGVDVHSLLDLFAGETAVTVTSQTRRPALLIVARTTHPATVRLDLASLELPLEQLFPAASSGPGQEPLFTGRQFHGITIHQLQLAPGLQLDYAVFGGLVAVSTGLEAIEQLARHERPLEAQSSYRSVVPSPLGSVTSLLFLDFTQLLRLGEQTGLVRGTGVGLLNTDLGRIRAVGLRSTSGANESTAELFLQIK
jgi:Protein of unknown function (DUF3352)